MAAKDTSGPLFQVVFDEPFGEYEPAPIRLKINADRAPRAKAAPREIDASKPLLFTVQSSALPGQDLRSYLKFTDPDTLPGAVIRCYVEPDTPLLELDSSEFNRVVRQPFQVGVKAAVKGESGTLQGKFQVKVESRVKIHWEWTGHPVGMPQTSGQDNTVILEADGASWFELKVWSTEWNAVQRAYLPVDPDAFEYSHWIAPGDPRITRAIFEPDPPTESIDPDDRQDTNDWYSRADLPDTQKFPLLGRLPIDTDIRVRAWERHSIISRSANAVDANLPSVGEVLIPVRLVRSLVLEIGIYIDDDDQPLKTYREVVEGDKVGIYCVNLPTDLDARMKWRVVRTRATDAPAGAPQETWTPLWPVTAPSGKRCLGTRGDIDLVDQPVTEADPIYLDVEDPDLRVELIDPPGDIILDGSPVKLTFGAHYLRNYRPAKRRNLVWRLLTQTGKTPGGVTPLRGLTDADGKIVMEYRHELPAVDEINRRIEEIRRDINGCDAGIRDARQHLIALDRYMTFVISSSATGVSPDDAWRVFMSNAPNPHRRVPGVGGSPFDALNPDNDILQPGSQYAKPPTLSGGPRESEALKLDLQRQVSADMEATRNDIAVEWPRWRDRYQRQLEEQQRALKEKVNLLPQSEEIDFYQPTEQPALSGDAAGSEGLKFDNGVIFSLTRQEDVHPSPPDSVAPAHDPPPSPVAPPRVDPPNDPPAPEPRPAPRPRSYRPRPLE